MPTALANYISVSDFGQSLLLLKILASNTKSTSTINKHFTFCFRKLDMYLFCYLIEAADEAFNLEKSTRACFGGEKLIGDKD
jgi:hypothetical protein